MPREAGFDTNHLMKKIRIFPRPFSLGPALLLVALLATGCAHYPANPFLKEVVPDEGYRMRNRKPAGNSDQILMVLTFSGGGTRAAALAYGVMEELARTEILVEGRKGMLLDEVDAISGVSGGSVIAAYYGLFGKRLFEDFESRFLKKNIQSDLLELPLNPGNWFRLWAPNFARTDLVAEYFDQNLYQGGTFGDMAAQKGPMIFINATDVTQGTYFTFCQDLFDILCSDLSRFPVGRAVAASAAVPVLLSPITLYNYAGSCSYREPEWVQQVLQDTHSPRRRYQQALQIKSYMDAERKPFIHLVDGGIADNLGLRGAMDRLLPRGEIWPSLQYLGLERVRKIVFLAVNAEKEPDQKLDQWERTLRGDKVVTSVLRIPMIRYNFETVQLVKERLREWTEEIRMNRCQEAMPKAGAEPKNLEPAACGDIQSYMIVVDPDFLASPSERAFFNHLPTSFSLPPETVDRIRETARWILVQSPEFQRLLQDLKE